MIRAGTPFHPHPYLYPPHLSSVGGGREGGGDKEEEEETITKNVLAFLNEVTCLVIYAIVHMFYHYNHEIRPEEEEEVEEEEEEEVACLEERDEMR